VPEGPDHPDVQQAGGGYHAHGGGSRTLSNGLEAKGFSRITDATSEVERLRDVLGPNLFALIEIRDGSGNAEEPIEPSGGHSGAVHGLAQQALSERAGTSDAPDGRR
jgi:hypothetical protein